MGKQELNEEVTYASVAELARAMYDQDMANAPIDGEDVLAWDKLTHGFYKAKTLALLAFVQDARLCPSKHPLGL